MMGIEKGEMYNRTGNNWGERVGRGRRKRTGKEKERCKKE